MKIRKLSAFLLALVVSVNLYGCGEKEKQVTKEEEKFYGTKIEKENTGDIEDIHLRDRMFLYENQDPKEVVTMYLTVFSGNSGENTDHTWNEINTYSVYDYDRMGVDRYKVQGLLQVGNEEGVLAGELGYNQISPNCTVQIRGQSSSLNAQKNYKISLKDNKGQWRGQSTIALNKHQGDGLRFRNKLVFDLINGIEQLMGLRTTFVHLYVKDTTAGGNGQFKDYGLYTQVEQLNKTALEAHGLDKRGHLYKINFCEFYRYPEQIKLKSDPTYDVKAFEELLEIKGDDDHQKLISMLDRLNNYTIPIETILEENFDVENISYWLALNILLGNIDTQSRNFYLYSPLNSEKWYILPWDNDASLKRAENAVRKRSDAGAWESGISNYWGNVLFKRCLKSEEFRKALDSAIDDLRSYLSPERITSMTNTYKEVVKPFVYKMPDRMYAPMTENQYEYVASEIIKEVNNNYLLYKESFEKPMPFYIYVPRYTGDKITYEWDASYDFDAENIIYSFELSRDYNFTNVIYREDDIVIPVVNLDKLPKGQYFVRVSARNTSGYSQYAFDYYILESGKVYGTKCFYVDGNGKILEDISVEG